VPTSAGEVQVDILEVTDADLARLPGDPTDRLHVLSHAWAAASATPVTIRAVGVPDLAINVAEPGPLVAMKLQAVMNRSRAKRARTCLTSSGSVSTRSPGRWCSPSWPTASRSSAKTLVGTPVAGSTIRRRDRSASCAPFRKATRSCWTTCASWVSYCTAYCLLVELRGFEPLTPSMRTRCATGLRHSPAAGLFVQRTGDKANRWTVWTANQGD
jgi:hypothetical protein